MTAELKTMRNWVDQHIMSLVAPLQEEAAASKNLAQLTNTRIENLNARQLHAEEAAQKARADEEETRNKVSEYARNLETKLAALEEYLDNKNWSKEKSQYTQGLEISGRFACIRTNHLWNC